MAKYSKKRTRPGRRRRGPYKKRRNTIKGVSRKLDKLYSAIEYKHFDRTYIDQRPTRSGIMKCLTDIGIGDTDMLRDGDKVTTTSLQLRIQIGGQAVHNLLRCVILKVRGNMGDTVDDDAEAMRDNIFQNPATQGLSRMHLWKYNVDYFRNSGAKILYDSFHDLVPTSTGVGTATKNVYLKKKFHFRQNLQYTAGTLRANHGIYLLVWGEQVTDNFAPYFSFTTRLNYIDL